MQPHLFTLAFSKDSAFHDPSAEINAFTLIRQHAELSPEQIAKITDANARALYGLG